MDDHLVRNTPKEGARHSPTNRLFEPLAIERRWLSQASERLYTDAPSHHSPC